MGFENDLHFKLTSGSSGEARSLHDVLLSKLGQAAFEDGSNVELDGNTISGYLYDRNENNLDILREVCKSHHVLVELAMDSQYNEHILDYEFSGPGADKARRKHFKTHLDEFCKQHVRQYLEDEDEDLGHLVKEFIEKLRKIK